MKQIEGGVCAPKGYTAGGIYCGIRKRNDKNDLALIFSKVPAHAAAVSGCRSKYRRLYILWGRRRRLQSVSFPFPPILQFCLFWYRLFYVPRHIRITIAPVLLN